MRPIIKKIQSSNIYNGKHAQNQNVKIIVYNAEDGSKPFEKWFSSLNYSATAKIVSAVDRIEQGNTSNIKWLGGGIGEYRINWGRGYRIYLAQEGEELIILFGGGTKKNQQEDILRAKKLYQEYKKQKKKTKKNQE